MAQNPEILASMMILAQQDTAPRTVLRANTAGGVVIEAPEVSMVTGGTNSAQISFVGPDIVMQSKCAGYDDLISLRINGLEGIHITKASSLAFNTEVRIEENSVSLTVASSVDEGTPNNLTMDSSGIYATDGGTCVELFHACAGSICAKGGSLCMDNLSSREIAAVPLENLFSPSAMAHAMADSHAAVGAVRLLGLKDQEKKLTQKLIIGPDNEADISALIEAHGLVCLRMATVLNNGALHILATGAVRLEGHWRALHEALLMPGGICVVLAVRCG